MRLNRYLLNEKTFNIKKDVDFIYKKSFKDILDIINKHWMDFFMLSSVLYKRLGTKKWQNIIIDEFDTSLLKTKPAREAHLANPAKIVVCITDKGFFYRPAVSINAVLGKTDSLSLIQLSFHGLALDVVLKGDFSLVPEKQRKWLKNEFGSDKVKASIAHELSHWISDTKHNFHISKLLKTAHELSKPDIVLLHKKNVNMTYFEIDAFVHAIKQVRSAHRKKWDSYNIEDLFSLYPSLFQIATELLRAYNKDVLDVWQKSLLKRLAREKLLGKGMKNFITPQAIRKLYF